MNKKASNNESDIDAAIAALGYRIVFSWILFGWAALTTLHFYIVPFVFPFGVLANWCVKEWFTCSSCKNHFFSGHIGRFNKDKCSVCGCTNKGDIIELQYDKFKLGKWLFIIMFILLITTVIVVNQLKD